MCSQTFCQTWMSGRSDCLLVGWIGGFLRLIVVLNRQPFFVVDNDRAGMKVRKEPELLTIPPKVQNTVVVGGSEVCATDDHLHHSSMTDAHPCANLKEVCPNRWREWSKVANRRTCRLQ